MKFSIPKTTPAAIVLGPAWVFGSIPFFTSRHMFLGIASFIFGMVISCMAIKDKCWRDW